MAHCSKGGVRSSVVIVSLFGEFDGGSSTFKRFALGVDVSELESVDWFLSNAFPSISRKDRMFKEGMVGSKISPFVMIVMVGCEKKGANFILKTARYKLAQRLEE